MASSTREPLGQGYWKLWTASVVSNLGDGVGYIAYPWLASALTRNPVAIAGMAIASRLPWLIFTLPAGVITDRVDRRKLVFGMDMIRFVITAAVALVVLAGEDSLPDPADLADGLVDAPSNSALALGLLYLAAMLLGSAEVLRDNSAQALMPSLVKEHPLERANGRMWGAEMVMGSFVGPPLAGLLIAIAFSIPFFVDAGSFAVAAALVFLLPGNFSPKPAQGETADAEPTSFRAELREGFGWLWHHELFRPMAIALGVLNAAGAMTAATEVLFAQEVLGLSAVGLGALGIAGAIGDSEAPLRGKVEQLVQDGIGCVSSFIFEFARDCQQLTSRQCELLEFLALGCTNERLAELSHTSMSTLKREIRTLLAATGCHRDQIPSLVTASSQPSRPRNERSTNLPLSAQPLVSSPVDSAIDLDGRLIELAERQRVFERID